MLVLFRARISPRIPEEVGNLRIGDCYYKGKPVKILTKVLMAGVFYDCLRDFSDLPIEFAESRWH